MYFHTILNILIILVGRLAIIFMFAYMVFQSRQIRDMLMNNKANQSTRLKFVIFFGLFGILGTYVGVPFNGAIANMRLVGVIVGGIYGGPYVGFAIGIIAGLHRMFYISNSIVSIICGIVTILTGIVSGASKVWLEGRTLKWLYAGALAIIMEIIQSAITFAVANHDPAVIDITKTLAIPNAMVGSVGVMVFVLVISQMERELDYAASEKSRLALKIASTTLPIMRNGLDEQTAKHAAEIICHMARLNAVSFTDREKILACVGTSCSYLPNTPVQLGERFELLESSTFIVRDFENHKTLRPEGCNASTAIIVPLRSNGEIVGSLKVCKRERHEIMSSEIELVKGLGELISTQLELSQIEYLKSLHSNAEIKALQAQIQPHFLFNALNTVIAYNRIDIEKSTQLLNKLSMHLRTRINTQIDMIPLSEELSNVKNYLDIEEARFSHRLKVIYDVDENICCDVPPLILQPIVENSIRHGLKNKLSNGLINIRVVDENGHILISIEDNGKGMDVDLLDLSNKKLKLNEGGIGLINVSNRIKAIYRSDLKIESCPNTGTRVWFLIDKKFRKGATVDECNYH